MRTTWPQNFCRRSKNSASFDCFRRYAAEVSHTAVPLGFHGFAAPRAIVLHALQAFMPTHVLELGRPTLATLESTAFLALGFGAVNGQDFRTRRDPLGCFTLFLISQLVSGSRVSLTHQLEWKLQGESTGGRIEFIYRIKQVCRTTMPTCLWILVVSSPTCLWWKRGPVAPISGPMATRACSPGKQNLFSNRCPPPKPTTKNQTTSNRLTQSQPFHVHLNQQTTSNRPTKKNG